MLSNVAIAGSSSFCGAWPDCVEWSRRQVADHPRVVAHILLARGGEKHGRVVAEFSADGERRITGGRVVTLKKVPAWQS